MSYYERHVLSDCLKWLNSQPHLWAWRRTVGVHRISSAHKERWISYGLKGQSDIAGIATVPMHGSDVGVHFEVEVKRPGGKPTPDQRAYMAAIVTHGGIAIWADSVTMLDAKLRASFSHRGWTWP